MKVVESGNISMDVWNPHLLYECRLPAEAGSGGDAFGVSQWNKTTIK